MRKTIAMAVTALTTAGLAAFVPATANAAGSGSTDSTFTVTGDPTGLAISVPDGSTTPIDLGTATAGAASLSNSLGNVTVTDTRANLTATWSVTASSTDFTTGGGSANETVTADNVGYFAGVGTAALGQLGAFLPDGTALTPVSLGTAAPVGSWTGTGNNTVTWNPTMTFTLLPSQVAGTYAGTITQSVS